MYACLVPVQLVRVAVNRMGHESTRQQRLAVVRECACAKVYCVLIYARNYSRVLVVVSLFFFFRTTSMLHHIDMNV